LFVSGVVKSTHCQSESKQRILIVKIKPLNMFDFVP